MIYQSHSSFNQTFCQTAQNLTKPTGLQVGDTLFGIFNIIMGSDFTVCPTVNTPTDWDQAFTEFGSVSFNGIRFQVFTKIADADDVAASNFPFSTNAGGGDFASRWSGVLYRLAGCDVESLQADAGFLGSYNTIGMTPASINSLMFIVGSAMNEQGAMSGQAITNNNPSWTEDYDNDGDGSHRTSVARAERAEDTATGNIIIDIPAQDGRRAALFLIIPPLLEPPTLDTEDATLVKITSAILHGEITLTGTNNSTERGFVWGTTTQADPGDTAPNVSGYDDYFTEEGDFGVSTFEKMILDLEPGTTYYVRAYSKNTVGYGYGDEITFTTEWYPPTITEINPPGILTNVSDVTITLTGTNFRTGLSIEVDGEVAEDIVYVDENTATFTAPLSALDKSSIVTLINDDDKSDTISFFYITGVSPTPQPGAVSATFSVKGVGYLN